MQSKWFNKKNDALNLRIKGQSIGSIEKRLGIPRSTLSGWFKSIKLTKDQEKVLYEKSKRGLIKARREAVKWHNSQKKQRFTLAKNEANKVLGKVNISNREWIEITLAILYLGEGYKTGARVGMGNSDPLILKFFLSLLKKIYGCKIGRIRCDLNLRADQNKTKEINYWSKALGLPTINFKGTFFDKRTEGRKTYKNYHGVCQVTLGRADIQRRLMYLADIYCNSIVKGNL